MSYTSHSHVPSHLSRHSIFFHTHTRLSLAELWLTHGVQGCVNYVMTCSISSVYIHSVVPDTVIQITLASEIYLLSSHLEQTRSNQQIFAFLLNASEWRVATRWWNIIYSGEIFYSTVFVRQNSRWLTHNDFLSFISFIIILSLYGWDVKRNTALYIMNSWCGNASSELAVWLSRVK